MNEKLNSLRDSLKELDPEQLKEIVRLQEQIKNEQIERNPFSAIISSAKELIELQKERAKLEGKYNYKSLEEVEDSYSSMKEMFEIQQAIVNAKREGTAKEGDIIQFRGKDVKLTNESLESEEEKLKALSDEYVEIKKIYELYVKLTNTEESAIDKIQKGFSETSSMFNSMSSSVSELASSFDKLSIGGQELQDIMSTTSDVLGGLGTIFEGGAMLASGNPFEMVAGGVKMLSGLSDTIASLWTAGDKKNEREIQSQIKLVDKLCKQYEKLEKQIDEAYSIDQLKGGMDAAKSNMEQQLAAYDNMIAAEEDKKKKDNSKIEEWKEAKEELTEQYEELQKEQIESMGGTYDYKDATREFVEAWIDAFNETGSGLDGLTKYFQEWWKDILVNQAVMKQASKIMQPLLDKVNKSLEDYTIDDKEQKDVFALADTVKGDLDNYLKEFYEKFGSLFTGVDDSGLSGLQRGIQGITESQADILASYLNSIRFYVSENNSMLSQYLNYQSETDEIENPMLGELRVISKQTSAINTLLEEVRTRDRDTAFNVRVIS
jgi:chromosome segregation ATPase